MLNASPPNTADDKFRSAFLWGRKPMLAACAARLQEQSGMIWVDLGGGTGVRPLPTTPRPKRPQRSAARGMAGVHAVYAHPLPV